MRTDVYKMVNGYVVEIIRENDWPLYVRSVYKGVARVYLDYTHAKGYSKKTAERIARQLESGELTMK